MYRVVAHYIWKEAHLSVNLTMVEAICDKYCDKVTEANFQDARRGMGGEMGRLIASKSTWAREYVWVLGANSIHEHVISERRRNRLVWNRAQLSNLCDYAGSRGSRLVLGADLMTTRVYTESDLKLL